MRNFSEIFFTVLITLFALATIATFIFAREFCAPFGVITASALLLILGIDNADRALRRIYGN